MSLEICKIIAKELADNKCGIAIGDLLYKHIDGEWVGKVCVTLKSHKSVWLEDAVYEEIKIENYK